MFFYNTDLSVVSRPPSPTAFYNVTSASDMSGSLALPCSFDADGRPGGRPTRARLLSVPRFAVTVKAVGRSVSQNGTNAVCKRSIDDPKSHALLYT